MTQAHFSSEFTPPVQRTIEWICCMQFIMLYFLYGPFMLAFFVWLLFTKWFFIPCLYFAWYLYDKESPFREGRPSKFVRELPIWRYLANYFPITLHKTVDLDPSKNYILAVHPHGCLGFSSLINFGTDGSGFTKTFPGIRRFSLTLDLNFIFPLVRDLALAVGAASVSARSIEHKLTKMGKGVAVQIVVGGAAEAALSDPNRPYQLVLKDRKGFVKMALKTGASLVPVFNFGETALYHNYVPGPGSNFQRIQCAVRRVFTFTPIIFYGSCLLMPFQEHIYTVFGEPIDVPLRPDPTEEELNQYVFVYPTYHAVYIEGLNKVFKDNVAKYGDPSKELELY